MRRLEETKCDLRVMEAETLGLVGRRRRSEQSTPPVHILGDQSHQQLLSSPERG
jgi:hypothetical protein